MVSRKGPQLGKVLSEMQLSVPNISEVLELALLLRWPCWVEFALCQVGCSYHSGITSSHLSVSCLALEGCVKEGVLSVCMALLLHSMVLSCLISINY